jgi:hypothetical protein
MKIACTYSFIPLLPIQHCFTSQAALLIAIACCALGNTNTAAAEPTVINLAGQIETFDDPRVIDQLSGDLQHRLLRPEPKDVVLVTDAPWEGNTSAYYTLFQDEDLFRAYYRGSHYEPGTDRGKHPEFTCYAESRDGIHWTKPSLGLFEFQGSKANNIVWAGPGTHNFTPFRDTNPDCPPAARYKALGCAKSLVPNGGQQGQALYAFHSPDGIHWSLMREEPVITEGAFDSQNLAFWDPQRRRYVEFHRTFRGGVRDIQTCTSTDFVQWTRPEFLQYPGAPEQQLYTNAIQLYDRDPSLFVGFPTRFLPNEGERVEPIFMCSRDGLTFHRWPEAVIPESAPQDRSGNRSNYMAWGILRLPHNPDEYSVYATEAYYTGPDSRLRRFTYRIDGFCAVSAGAAGGTLLTRPFTFSGDQLQLNFRSEPGGSLEIALLQADGSTIPGFEADACRPLQGDHLAQTVTWTTRASLNGLANSPVKLQIELQNTTLFSFFFTASKPTHQEHAHGDHTGQP